MKLYCTKCKYKFEKNIQPGRCPYCGNDNTLKQVESAQNILDETIEDLKTIEKSRKERSS